jgi:hypothetical protein
MLIHGATSDSGNDALFAVANLGFGVEDQQEQQTTTIKQLKETQKDKVKGRSESYHAVVKRLTVAYGVR